MDLVRGWAQPTAHLESRTVLDRTQPGQHLLVAALNGMSDMSVRSGRNHPSSLPSHQLVMAYQTNQIFRLGPSLLSQEVPTIGLERRVTIGVSLQLATPVISAGTVATLVILES